MSIDVPAFIAKAAEKTGFLREVYAPDRVPTDPRNIACFVYFGDLRSMTVLSSLLLNRYREEEKASKYFILCSWPGFKDLFPYVDEYWSLKDEEHVKRLFTSANQFKNKSELAYGYYRNLSQYFFEDVTFGEAVAPYYYQGISNEFWDKYKFVRGFLPTVSSATGVNRELSRELAMRGGYKVFLFPAKYVMDWRFGTPTMLPIPETFWVGLTKFLMAQGITPVLWDHPWGHRIVDDCLHYRETDIGKVLAVMRVVGCVLDVFNDISRLATAARCPFVSFVDRAKYIAMKEYELDDLFAYTLPKQYIFSFPTIIEGGSLESWNPNIFTPLIKKLNSFLPSLNRENWPSTGEINEVISYDRVRRKKLKKLGTKFIRVTQDG